MKKLSNRLDKVKKELPVKESTEESLREIRQMAENIRVDCAI